MGIFISNNQKFSKENYDIKRMDKWKITYQCDENGKHSEVKKIDDKLVFYYGNIYDDEYASVINLYNNVLKNGYNSLMGIDGEFIFGIIEDNNLILVSDREGFIPVYYRQYIDGFCITTEIYELFSDYSEEDIDYEAVNDYLRHGNLVGNRTFSNKVKLLESGSQITYCRNIVSCKRLYLFHYKEDNQCIEKELIREVEEKYKTAIIKRINGDGSETGVFLSGGIDSRFLLACLNQITSVKVKTISFGQDNSEEVMIANQCANVNKNDFKWKKLEPKDFIIQAEKYIMLTCGMDMFPQSYILGTIENVQFSQFMTGFILDAYFGGTFISEEAIQSNEPLSEFIKKHLGLIKMKCFSEFELEDVMKEEAYEEFKKYGINDLVNAAKEYDKYALKDVIQPFTIKNRAIRMVMLRENTPGRYLSYANPSLDLELSKVVAKIPSKLRVNHRFYQKLFCSVAKDYASIPYNNTTLPVETDVSDWKIGVSIERKREELYEKFMLKHNPNSDKKIYYPHFYSDFNGYSRYDSEWKSLFHKYLLDDTLFIYKKLFKFNKINDFYKQHIECEHNRRKELVYLTSLSMFFELFLEGKRSK